MANKHTNAIIRDRKKGFTAAYLAERYRTPLAEVNSIIARHYGSQNGRTKQARKKRDNGYSTSEITCVRKELHRAMNDIRAITGNYGEVAVQIVEQWIEKNGG